MKKYQELKKQLLKDKKISKEYGLLGPEFMIKRKLIEFRLGKSYS